MGVLRETARGREKEKVAPCDGQHGANGVGETKNSVRVLAAVAVCPPASIPRSSIHAGHTHHVPVTPAIRPPASPPSALGTRRGRPHAHVPHHLEAFAHQSHWLSNTIQLLSIHLPLPEVIRLNTKTADRTLSPQVEHETPTAPTSGLQVEHEGQSDTSTHQ